MTTQSGEGGKKTASPKLARRLSDDEIRECISSGWEYRSLREHEDSIVDILCDMLDGKCREAAK